MRIDDVEGRTAADVMHPRPATLPASATVADLRAYFEESTSHRLALLADGKRFAGAVPSGGLPAEALDSEVAAAYAGTEPSVLPSAPAAEARDVALSTPERRVAVVDDGGALLGLIAIDKHHTRFCGVGPGA